MAFSKFKIAFLVLILFVGLGCKKDKVEINNAEDFETYLTDEILDQNIPALSVLIFNESEVKYEKLLGESDVDQGTALGSDHLFLLASVSKVVTATALLQLYDQGEFQLNDRVNDYLSFPVNVPGAQTDITFKMLLTHTSGIADGPALDGQYYYGVDSPVDLAGFLGDYLVPGHQYYDANENYHNFEPGEEHEYSNVGNALIAVLVEQISGIGFNAYCKQNIFAPLGMSNTFWRLDEINQPIAIPYDYNNRGYDAIQHYTFTDYPNGGLRSNARDLHKLLSAFTQAGRANNYQLLKAATAASMYNPQVPDIDPEVGLHMFRMDADNNLWGHDGGEQGVATIMAFNPSTKVGAIVLANQGDAELEDILGEAYQLGLKL